MDEKLDYQRFNLYVGKTIEYAQTIEHDIKWLYCLLIGGNLDEMMTQIRSWTLGETIKEIKVLDDKGYDVKFSDKDYRILSNLTKDRNYVCHEIYRSFLYADNWLESVEYKNACQKLLIILQNFKDVYKEIEKYRLNLAKIRFKQLKHSK
ncbi:hypothetical protein [Acholeplasma equifetale]|uniref:hypothetical protein n=1 Tax=Acholeplasma equifetale TaxID=264634 RepID=UPI00138AE4F8|nr:hypothetical protein [Acholeplasma equifetale]